MNRKILTALDKLMQAVHDGNHECVSVDHPALLRLARLTRQSPEEVHFTLQRAIAEAPPCGHSHDGGAA